MPTAAALTVLAACTYWGPEHIAAITGGSHAATAYIAHGLEAAGLWLLLLVITWRRPASIVCAWGAAEALMRVGCRISLPLDRAPALQPGETLCQAAWGRHAEWISTLAAAAVACWLARGGAHGR